MRRMIADTQIEKLDLIEQGSGYVQFSDIEENGGVCVTENETVVFGSAVNVVSGEDGINFVSSLILMASLPASDPQVEGALWNDSGVLKVSAGE